MSSDPYSIILSIEKNKDPLKQEGFQSEVEDLLFQRTKMVFYLFIFLVYFISTCN